ncbi:MAG: RDD family protein [Cyanobacteria bacterium P01_A01_bin.17]
MGPRIIAGLIDLVIILLMSVIITLLSGLATSAGMQVSPPTFIGLGLFFFYPIGFEGILGATIGKMIMGQKIVKTNGFPIDLPTAIVRNILRPIDAIPFFLPYLTGLILIQSSPKQQRLGDRIAKTVVVSKPGRRR